MLDAIIVFVVVIYYLPRGAPRKGRDGDGGHVQGAQRGEQRRGAEILLFKYFYRSEYCPPPRDGEPLRGCRPGARSGGGCGARWAGGTRAGVDIVDIYLVYRYSRYLPWRGGGGHGPADRAVRAAAGAGRGGATHSPKEIVRYIYCVDV